jgi:hypothetical protein
MRWEDSSFNTALKWGLTKEGSSRYPRWYLTDLGKTELIRFDIDIQKILRKEK